ncbi:MAG: hypothetical protein JOZ29_06660 [Deltaproteobacteria bacterium]|nr:hypothetical protein [Deltaproteobacteria bacterium]
MRRSARPTLAVLLGVLALGLSGQSVIAAGESEVDTQFIFGFTQGADVGELGEREIEHQTIARLGKRDGSYTALSEQLRYELTPVENFRFELGAPLTYFRIANVAGLDDRRQWAFDGLVAEMRYRLLDRERAPFGLTIGAEPHWSRTDEVSGEPVQNYGGDLSLVLDKELIEDRVYAALNLVYDPEVTRFRFDGSWERQATTGTFVALTTQVVPDVFFGAEARYLRQYQGLDLGRFAGEALFVGPTMFIRFSKTLAISGAWNFQVAGRAATAPGALDLTNFERQQALLRLEYNF